jgi:hypothetical protein
MQRRDNQINNLFPGTAPLPGSSSLIESLDISIEKITQFAKPKPKPLTQTSSEAKEDIDNSQLGEGISDDKHVPSEDKANEELENFEIFKRSLQELRASVAAGYLSAVTNDEKQKIYLFVTKFNETIEFITNKNNKRNYNQAIQALHETHIAADQCQLIWHIVEKGVSPIAYILGGIAGFLIGIPVGAVLGPVVGICMLCYIGGDIPSDPVFWKGFFLLSAFCGAIYGAMWGATELSKTCYGGSQRFFKPHSPVNEIAPKVLGIISSITNVLHKQIIHENTNLIPDLVNLVMDYIPKEDLVIPNTTSSLRTAALG